MANISIRKRRQRGASLVELAIITPLLILLFGVGINVGFYLLNLWTIQLSAFPAAFEVAVRGTPVAFVASRAQEIIEEDGVNLENISVTSSWNAGILTLTASVDYRLLFPVPGYTTLNINASASSYHPTGT